MQWLLFVWIGVFSYLIIDWIFNQIRIEPERIIEGIANASKTKPDASTKCPEDCTSVKELQTKLSASMKTIEQLESNIARNTAQSAEHSNSIRDMNQAITDMQKDQKDE